MLRSITWLCALAAAAPVPAQAEPLSVCASTPNLGALARAIAGDGDDVEVTVFARPSQDPHFVRALPSFVKQLNQADLLVSVGLELEHAWLPAVIDQARNADVRPGAPGFLAAANAVQPLGRLGAQVDRSAGDIHLRGNPHFMVDPVSGALVADALAKRMGTLRPRLRQRFLDNARALRQRLGELVIGADLAATYDFTKLARLQRAGKLDAFLRSQGDLERLGGAFAAFASRRGDKVIADHDAWRYLTATLGLETIGFLEPRPGIAPTTSHLRALVERALVERPRALLHVSYFEQRAIRFVADNAEVTPVLLAHQVGSVPETSDYVAMIRHNLQRLEAALAAEPGSGG